MLILLVYYNIYETPQLIQCVYLSTLNMHMNKTNIQHNPNCVCICNFAKFIILSWAVVLLVFLCVLGGVGGGGILT